MNPFDYAFECTLSLECGYSDDPADRGGRTNWGITQEPSIGLMCAVWYPQGMWPI
jgi:lysozyme family protein